MQFGSVSHHQTVLTLNKCIKSRASTNADTVSYVHLCLVCMCCVSHQVLSSFVSIILAVCPFPSLLL